MDIIHWGWVAGLRTEFSACVWLGRELDTLTTRKLFDNSFRKTVAIWSRTELVVSNSLLGLVKDLLVVCPLWGKGTSLKNISPFEKSPNLLFRNCVYNVNQSLLLHHLPNRLIYDGPKDNHGYS